MDGVEEARIRGSGWSAVRDWRALRAERRLLVLELFVIDQRSGGYCGPRYGMRAEHVPCLEIIYFREHLCVADMFYDVFDTLHLEFGVRCEEADGYELGAGGARSSFGTLRCGYDQGRRECLGVGTYVSLTWVWGGRLVRGRATKRLWCRTG